VIVPLLGLMGRVEFEVALGSPDCSVDLVVGTVADEGESHGLQREGAPEHAGAGGSFGVCQLRE
jgi:hypothetical protein